MIEVVALFTVVVGIDAVVGAIYVETFATIDVAVAVASVAVIAVALPLCHLLINVLYFVVVVIYC